VVDQKQIQNLIVDRKKLRDLWVKYFDTQAEDWKAGEVTVHPDGSLSVDNNVFLLKNTSSLPIKFSRVEGRFDAGSSDLENLSNFPTYVAGDLDLRGNHLTNLIGAPSHIGDDLLLTDNPLVSLEGFPAHVGGTASLPYSANLPLLRSLTAQRIMIPGRPTLHKILNKYAGEGRAGAIDCKRELVAAGFEGNAKW